MIEGFSRGGQIEFFEIYPQIRDFDLLRAVNVQR